MDKLHKIAAAYYDIAHDKYTLSSNQFGFAQ